MKELHEAVKEYLEPAQMVLAGFVVSGPVAFVLVRASLGDFSLQLIRGPEGWTVTDELEAGDYYAHGGKEVPR